MRAIEESCILDPFTSLYGQIETLIRVLSGEVKLRADLRVSMHQKTINGALGKRSLFRGSNTEFEDL